MGVNMKHIVRFTTIGLSFFFFGAATLLTGNPEHQTETESTAERNKALVLKWSDALRNKDMATALALVTDDWVIHGAGVNFPRGPEGLKQWQGYIDAMWANARWTDNDIFVEGDKVVRRTTVYRTWKFNNKDSAMTVSIALRIAKSLKSGVWQMN
jgi:ketosteroid isomerase-like protein